MPTNGHTASSPGAELGLELEHFRLSLDWSYKELATSIARLTGRKRDGDCWRKICQGLARPQQTTVDIMNEFLDVIQTPRKRASARLARQSASRRRSVTRKSAARKSA